MDREAKSQADKDKYGALREYELRDDRGQLMSTADREKAFVQDI